MSDFLDSELPVRAMTRQHPVVLLRAPRRATVLTMIVLLVASILWPNPMAFVFVFVLGGLFLLRVREWRAEWIILTGTRIIRTQGVTETTSSEASLRVDRISGLRYVVTVPGKFLHYGTVEVEAPGDHPGTRRLLKLWWHTSFYTELRQLVFGGGANGRKGSPATGGTSSWAVLDEDEDYLTEPLPALHTDE